MELNLLKEKFKSLFGTEGTMYTSPGRINLIGEHTDYNGGFVLPGAIDKAMYCVIKPNGTPDRIKAYAMDLSEMDEFGLDDIPIKECLRQQLWKVVSGLRSMICIILA